MGAPALARRCDVRVSTPRTGYPFGWVPILRMGTRRAALHLNLFDQPERKRVFQHPANSEQDACATEGERTEHICVNEYLKGA